MLQNQNLLKDQSKKIEGIDLPRVHRDHLLLMKRIKEDIVGNQDLNQKTEKETKIIKVDQIENREKINQILEEIEEKTLENHDQDLNIDMKEGLDQIQVLVQVQGQVLAQVRVLVRAAVILIRGQNRNINSFGF